MFQNSILLTGASMPVFYFCLRNRVQKLRLLAVRDLSVGTMMIQLPPLPLTL